MKVAIIGAGNMGGAIAKGLEPCSRNIDCNSKSRGYKLCGCGYSGRETLVGV